MNPTSCSNSVTGLCCPLCPENDNTQVQFSDRAVDKTVVETSCQPGPHTYHLECITRHFENSATERKCVVCHQEPLPLLRADGARLVEDSPYCESRALAICRRGDAASLDLLLAEAPEAATGKFRSAQTGDFVSLLSVVASLGYTSCLHALISRGANDLETALARATAGRHLECLKLLIEEGMKNLDQDMKNTLSRFEELRPLFAKADITFGPRNRAQVTFEHKGRELDHLTSYCALLGHAECLQVLIDNGAKSGMPLIVAADSGHINVMRVVLNSSLLTSINYSTNLSLLIAADAGRSDCLKLLLEHIKNINPGALKEAMDQAGRQGHSECVKLLDESISRTGAMQFIDEGFSENEILLRAASIAETQSPSLWSCAIL